VKLAERLTRLGTETAFKVSAEAAAWAAKGNRVYPFHLGDINIPTPQNIVEASFKAIKDGKTGYCPNAGIAPLREALAADINRSHGTHYGIDNVSIQPGGKPVIGKFLLTLMNPGDEVLYPNPGFPIYESLIEFHGGKGLPYAYREGKTTFELDLDGVEKMITPKTRLLILNDLQNPTGAEASAAELSRIAALVQKHNLYVLCDEAYIDVRFSGKSRSLLSLPGMEERCVMLYTFGKKFAMTGWRLGAALGPKEVIEMITRLNVNEESCPNHFIQYGAIEALTGDQSGCAKIIQILKERRDKAMQILNSTPGIKCLKPEVTFYLYPNVTDLMKRKGMTDYDALRTTVLHQTGVSFCTRRHFGRPFDGETQYYVRLAYSGINTADIEEGLTKVKAFAEA
jgi:aspartate/methionine/tyrosine aminotransferase